MKTYTRRDSATALLRKMGIASDLYNKFITVSPDGFTVDDTAAMAYSDSLAHAKPAKQSVSPKLKPRAASSYTTVPAEPEHTAEAKPARPKSVAARIRDLINDGLDNQAIFASLADVLDESKKWYPAWYRAKMARDAKKV